MAATEAPPVLTPRWVAWTFVCYLCMLMLSYVFSVGGLDTGGGCVRRRRLGGARVWTGNATPSKRNVRTLQGLATPPPWSNHTVWTMWTCTWARGGHGAGESFTQPGALRLPGRKHCGSASCPKGSAMAAGRCVYDLLEVPVCDALRTR